MPTVKPESTNHPVSVLVLTKNEEFNIGACLDCLGFSDDIVLYDSYSNDGTIKAARGYSNVSIVQREFDDWASHQNWGVSNVPFKHPWVLYVDADERVPDDLAAEVQRSANPEAPESAFRLRRKDYFMGRWLRHAQLYPTWLVRLFRPAKVRYERLVNPIVQVDGPIGRLDGHIIHYPFSKGVSQWLERHDAYASFEAEEMLKIVGGKHRPLLDILGRDPNDRRAALKDLFYRLPMRPQIKWLYYVLWRRAFLDGSPGMTYARLQYIYEHMILIKARELDLRQRLEATRASKGHSSEQQ